MASAVGPISPLEVVESAIHWLREEGIAALLPLWIGAAPFAAVCLLFFRDATVFPANPTRCAFDAVLLTAALAWLNICRGSFSRRFLARMHGETISNSRPPGRTLLAHAATGNWKLLAAPVLVLTGIGWPLGMAFFRLTIASAAARDLAWRDAMRRARSLLEGEWQSWHGIWALLAFAAVAVFLNVTAALAILPHLVRMVTGYETMLSRAGSGLLAEPGFWLAVTALTWLSMEPLVQASYCVAAFQKAAQTSAEDIRAKLRLLSTTTALAVVLLSPAAAPAQNRDVNPDELQDAIEQTLSLPEYGWRVEPQSRASDHTWVSRMAETMGSALSAVIRLAEKPIRSILDWLFDRKVPPNPKAAPSSALDLNIVLPIALLALAVTVILIAVRYRRHRNESQAVASAPVGVKLDAEHLTADQLPEDEWLILADDRAREGDYRLAVRALYLANLSWLGGQGILGIHPAKTNAGYRREFRRRARGYSSASDAFDDNLRAFERIWYGKYPAEHEDYESFQRRNSSMREQLARSSEAAA